MVNSLQGGLHGFYGTWQRCNSLEWERPEALPEGPREAGIGQWRGCRAALVDTRALASRCGSHLPAEDTAPPYAVAPFHVIAPCPAP